MVFLLIYMSVQNETNRVQYWGNASAVTAYPVPFYFFESRDLRVVVTDADGADSELTEGSDYSVTGEGNENGGAVLTVMAVPAASRVTIFREVEAIQTTVYEENGEFPAKTHERALDRQTMLNQQNARAFDRALKVRESDGKKDELATVANSVIGFGGDFQPRTYTPEQLAVWMNLTQQVFGQGTKTWLTNSDRSTARPDFLGQVGVQLDKASLWVANGTSAGNWTEPVPGIVDGSISTVKLADGALSADSTGRAKMADAFITLAKIGAGIFTADSAGRGKFAPGFIDSGLCTSDLWNAIAPAGAVLQTVTVSRNDELMLIPQIPFINAKPTSSAGTPILAASITPISTSNKIRIQFGGFLSVAAAVSAVYALFRSGTTDCLGTWAHSVGGDGYSAQVFFEYTDSPASISAQTYSVRCGPNAPVSICINRYYTFGSRFNGTLTQTLTLQEIKG